MNQKPEDVLTDDDIDQIAEGIEHFIIGIVDPDPEIIDIWQPYIDKLNAYKQMRRSQAQM